MEKPQAVTFYRNSPSQGSPRTPADAGSVEDVVRCVAGLYQKGIIDNISLKSSHELFKIGQGYTYEVIFLRGERTLKRRFTVYRLGGIHSKSACYQVTDPKGKYMVVKIPPHPITDINTYLTAVSRERKLAKKIFDIGIKVVVPCVSSVMKHLHALRSAKKLSSEEMETAYLGVLRRSGEKYVEQFKIGGRFAFFMEFLDEPFLGRVVREFYNKEMLQNLKREYFDRDLLLLHYHDKSGFMRQYKHIGCIAHVNEIYRGLRKSFNFFCEQLDSLPTFHALPLGILTKMDWFVANSLGKLSDDSSFQKHCNADHCDKNQIIDRLITLLDQPAEKLELQRYLDILDREARWTAFKYGTGRMRMIGNNLLILLVMLKKMGLVLRDLKVDNLFIADDENMELGVIDLETGSYIGSEKIEGIVPAGMPSNMTLSNLLFVNQLKRIYGEKKVSTILHMQDWYAALSMMFETNIGSILFDDAHKYILKINREIDENLGVNHSEFVRNNPDVRVTPTMIESFFSLSDEDIKGHTWQFWTLAKENLLQKCTDHKTKLQEIEYEVPSELKIVFLDYLEEELQHIQKKYSSYRLTAASIAYLNQPTTTIDILLNNLALKEQLFVAKTNQRPTRCKIKTRLAQEIEIYKACILQKQKEVAIIARKNILNQPQISAFDLFPIMLDCIIRAMCQDDWLKYSPEAKSISSEKNYSSCCSILPSKGWKSTIFISKDKLPQKDN